MSTDSLRRGASGSDEKISGAKIEPLDSDQKVGVPHDQSSRGVAGSDRNIDQTRIDPIGGANESFVCPLGSSLRLVGQYQHTVPHADSEGVIGTDETIGAARIDPLGGTADDSRMKHPGLDDETVDKARTEPLGGVREEVL